MKWGNLIPKKIKKIFKKEDEQMFNPLQLYHTLILRGYKVKEFTGQLIDVVDNDTIYVPARNSTNVYLKNCKLLALINVYNINIPLHTVKCKIKNYVRTLN